MIHIPDHLVSFCNISERSGASGTNTLDRAEQHWDNNGTTLWYHLELVLLVTHNRFV